MAVERTRPRDWLIAVVVVAVINIILWILTNGIPLPQRKRRDRNGG